MTLRQVLPTAIPLGTPEPPGRLRIALATVAVLACLPYVVLKAFWLAGSDVGVNDPSVLEGTVMEVANLVTVLMELAGGALAVALVLPVGRRLPASLVQVPMFVGTGLLGGILAVIPTQMLLMTVTEPPAGTSSSGEPAIQGWVYLMVYGAFAVLGLCLLAIFALHARDRWVRPGGWATRLGSWTPVSRTLRRTAVGHGAVLVVLAVAEVAVAVRSDFFGGHQLVAVLMALVATAALTALAARAPGGLRGSTALVAAYVAAAVIAAWGLYFAVVLSIPSPLQGDEFDVPPGLVPIEAAKAVVGALVLATLYRLRPQQAPMPSASS